MNAVATRAPSASPRRTASGIQFEVHGDGVPLILGFPLMASHAQIFGAAAAAVREGFLSRLTDRYRVLLVDYPSVGGSETIAPSDLTVERACADMLEVADEAGFDRFAWWGGTFGAVVGLALAASSDRVSALIAAGWPPLGVPFAAMAHAAQQQLPDPPPHARVMLRQPAQYAQWITFYTSLPNNWDAAVVPRIRCPRAVIYGANAESSVGNTPLPLAATIRARRGELEALGWHVVELAGCDSSLILDPVALGPAGRGFLDSVFPIRIPSREI
jgi:pimeloyl-ACP methyl ester carboxylesterase